MSQPATGAKQYFLGIEGEQTGPYTETDLLSRIKKSLVPADSLIWHDGMTDWQAINTVEPFKTTLELVQSQTGGLPSEVAAPAVLTGTYKPKAKPKAGKVQQSDFTFSESGNAGEPVFKPDGKQSFLGRRVLIIAGGLVALGLGCAAVFFFQAQIQSLLAGAGPVAVQIKPPAPVDQREIDLRKAQSELMLTPDASLKLLSDIVKTSPGDKVGQEALSTAVDYYKKMQRPTEAGRLLIVAKQPAEAAKFFLVDPPAYKEAEEAYYLAFQSSQVGEPKRREFLIEDIKVLLGPLNNVERATVRIRELEKNFPNQPHPFQYYSKSADEKIADIFSRISFYFVQNLLSYLNAELPQIVLTNRPLIEIKKDRQAMYRIVGSYKGEVHLNQDTLQNIFFVFWLVNDQWVIADTNLTLERQKFAKEEREKHGASLQSSNEMLEFLQQVFRTHFPTTALHEQIDQKKSRARNIVE